MTEHKFTDEEVIKALEWCSQLRLCVDCPLRAKGYFSHSGNACRNALMKNALDLINRQKAEIERLQKYNTDVAFKHYNDGIKEFAERLKGKRTSICSGHGMSTDVVYIGHIDAIAKEMMGEEK